MSFRRVRASILLCLLGAASASVAHEPDGHVRFLTEGPLLPNESPPGFDRNEKLLRLEIQAIVPLSRVALVHDAPPAVSQRLVALGRGAASPRPVEAGAVRSPGRLELGDLTPGQPVVIQFAEAFDEKIGGLVTFVLEWPGPDGTLLRERIGVVVGTPGRPAEMRNGAVEFPAAVIPDPGP